MAAFRGEHGQAAETETACHQLDQDAADDGAVSLRHDGAAVARQLDGDGVGGLAKGARLGPQLAAILLERGGDGAGEHRSIGGGGGTQDKMVAHGSNSA